MRDYPPEWEQIQQVLQSAKDKVPGKLPPSEQKKAEARAREAKGDGK